MTDGSSRSEPPVPPANGEAKVLLLMFLGFGGWIVVLFLLGEPSALVLPTIYILPVLLCITLYLSIRLALQGAAAAPKGLVVTGILCIVGGGLFDMLATVIHTPDLRHEMNPIARALLDSGYRVSFVYRYGVAAQALWLGSVCTVWIGLLRHRDDLRTSVDTTSVMRFLKSATGGSDLTWRQWIVPLTLSELPRAYHLFWVAVVVILSGAVDRWYLGLEWFGLVSSARLVCYLAAVTVGLSVYFVWLWSAAIRDTTTS